MARQYETITLVPAERLLRELLFDCREAMRKAQVTSAFDLEMWITGGWVRDRLLGIPCSDIDIAFSTMTGQQFSRHLTQTFETNKARYQRRAAELGVQDDGLTGFHTTKRNPKKSKKLETTVGKAFGLDLDLVNLRKEVYEENSRTPEMEFGTAKEDAFRRDATINSLFFNLDTGEVVDFTGRGLDDLAAGSVRTPLKPRQTFMDDPLRVLRLIRIANKLGFTIDKEAMRWMKDKEVHSALSVKVSRERIGIEIFKMMKQPKPQLAFQILFDTDLYALVFLGSDSSLCQALQDRLPALHRSYHWPNTWPRAYQTLGLLLQDKESSLGKIARPVKEVELLWVTAAYAPIAGLCHDMLKQGIDAATGALKLTRKTSKLLETSLCNLRSIRDIVGLVARSDHAPARSAVGMAIRAWGPTWRLQVIFALLADLVCDPLPSPSPSTSPPLYTGDDTMREKLLSQYNTFIEYVLREDLEDAYLLRPGFNGNDIMDLLGIPEDGSFLQNIIDDLVAWQLDHEGCGTEEAKEWLFQQKDSWGIPGGV